MTLSILAKQFRALFITSSLICAASASATQVEIDQIEHAAATLNMQALTELTQTTQGYELALAHYRLGLSANIRGDSDLAAEHIDIAMETLEALNDSHEQDVEIKALLAQVYGYKVALQPLSGIYYGPKSQAVLDEAHAIAPMNPRVLLVTGIGALNTPPMFGGSATVALDAFDQAIAQFEQDAYSDYHWGYAEAYTWRGLVHMQQDNVDKAMADWQQALLINPNYGWAKSLLDGVKS